MRISGAALMLAGLAAAASGCDGDARPAAVGKPPLAAGDTQVVPASERAVWSAPPRLVEELRIGQIEGDDRYLFGRIGELAIAEDGTIFVVDEQGPRLRMYDAEGHFVREIGRTGGGPGEYRQIAGMGLTPAGELAVFDPSLRRVSFFSPSGDFVRSFDSRVGGNWTDNSFHVDADGNFLVFGVRASPAAPVMIGPDGTHIGSEGPGHQIRFYLRLSPDGEVLDTLTIPESQAPQQPKFFLMTKEGDFSSFGNDLVYDLTPQGRFVSAYTSEQYRIDIETGDGKVLRIERDYEPVQLGREERSQWEAVAEHITRNRGGISSGTRIPAVKPAFRNVEVDADGRIWVHRYARATERVSTSPRPPGSGPGVTWRDIPTFDVFDLDGRFLGTVLTPPDTRMLVRRGERLWGVYRGEFDESYIVRYRMELSP